MDTEICGLNKVIVVDVPNGQTVTVTDGTNTWSKVVASGKAEFIIPSVPAPGKKSFIATYGSANITFELGFGDVKKISFNAKSINNDYVIAGTGLSKSGSTINFDQSAISTTSPITKSGTSIAHSTSGVATGIYGSSANSIPYFTVNDTGHITSAGVRTPATYLSNDNSVISGKAVCNALGGTTLASGFYKKTVSTEIEKYDWTGNAHVSSLFCGVSGYTFLGIVGYKLVKIGDDGGYSSQSGDYMITDIEPNYSTSVTNVRILYTGNVSKSKIKIILYALFVKS